MTIKSTFIWTSIHTAIKILSGIIMNKVIAVYLGPVGLAMIGQFQNFVAIVSSISNASIQTGILTQTAKFNNEHTQKIVWVNGLIINCFFALLTSIFIFIFANWLSKQIFFSINYINLIYILSFSLIFYGLNLYILAIINGLGNIKLYTIINMLISILTLILVSVLTIFFKFEGAILGIILTQSIVFIISYMMIYRHYKNSFFIFRLSLFDKSIFKTLLSYGLTSFLSGIIVAISSIVVRIIIVNNSSLENAGLWEAAIKIGFYFNMIFTLPISIFYLPKFSTLNMKKEFFILFKQAIVFILPIMFLFVIIFFIFKDFLINLLFSNKFLAITDFMIIILFAEILRVSISLFSNLLLSKKAFKEIIILEFLTTFLFVLYVYVFYDILGLFGLSLGYLIISFCMLFMYIYQVKRISF
ncbi:Lipid III flippase [bioreactor metagenome]|uniref:Lipid III flippase n=1 Tax=bioreactor metagenome TaxID=1076179 RepID=A0A644UGY7_9ZZZZ